MRVLTAGISQLGLADFLNLEEPIPFELGRNCRQRIVVAESHKDLHALLKELQVFSRAGNQPSIRRILEGLSAAPNALRNIDSKNCDISISSPDDICRLLVGEGFARVEESIFKPIVAGMHRDEVFDTRLGRLLPACSSITILDRYLAAQLCQDEYKNSGAFWVLSKIFATDIRDIELLSSGRDAKNNLDVNVFIQRINEMRESNSSHARVHGKLGYTAHDRHISFYFSQGKGSQALTLGAGADIFKNEILKEGFAIETFNATTAAQNEKSVLESRGNIFDF